MYQKYMCGLENIVSNILKINILINEIRALFIRLKNIFGKMGQVFGSNNAKLEATLYGRIFL